MVASKIVPFVLVAILALFNSTKGDALEAPFTIGSSCESSSSNYLWETLVRTKWSIDLVVTLPTEVSDPDEWEATQEFRTRMVALLEGNTDAESFAEAIMVVWTEFTGNSSNIFIRFTRHITITERNVACDSVWTVASSNDTATTDYSEWLRLDPQSYSYSQTLASELSSKMEELLTDLNSQPGSDTTPSHSYTPVQ